MLLQAWILPVPHARMQSEHNSLIPPHVPIKVNISSADVQHFKNNYPRHTFIKNISPTLNFIRTGETEYKLTKKCTIYNGVEAHLVLHDVHSVFDEEELRSTFHETLSVEFEEDIPAILCFAAENRQDYIHLAMT